MTDCPKHGPVDGLFCRQCMPKAGRNPPIDPAVKARIDATLRSIGRLANAKRDPEADAERQAIQDEAAW
jgi:hypothetical protein